MNSVGTSTEPLAAEQQQAEATVLFADVAGSTRLYEQLGDTEAMRRVAECLAAAQEAARDYGGEVVKTIGDEVMCLFPDSGAALLAACAMQSAVRSLPRVGDVPMALRVGFHSGPVLRSADDAYGDTVNVAARVVSLAGAGQILLGDASCHALPGYLRYGVRALGQASLRGRNAEIQLHEVVWDLGADLTLVGATLVERSVVTSGTLELTLGSDCWRLESGSITIGRDAVNQIVLSTRRASRNHARIEARQGRFFVKDNSTNGTFVCPDVGDSLRLNREETPLQGCGSLFFGDTPGAEGAEEVRYAVR